MRSLVYLCLSVIAICGVTGVSQAQFLVYSQPADSPDGPFSDGIDGQFYSTCIADNFTLVDPDYRTIVEVTWWGSSENMNYVHLDNCDSWVVKFYNDDDGLPGDMIHVESIRKEDTSPVATGNYNMDGGAEYMQTLMLAAPVTLYVEQQYWISIGAVLLDSQEDAWRWSLNYFDGDNLLAADYFDGAGYTVRQGDTAFVLLAEPSGGCPLPGCEVGDLDGDCEIGLSDLAQLLANYGQPDVDPNDGDLDGDGDVDLSDLALLLSLYGTVCY